MKTMRVPVAAIVLILVSGSLSFAAEKRFEKRFTVSSRGTLVVSTDEGSVRVTGGAGNEVVIEALMRGKQRDLDEFDISASETSQGIEVKGKRPRKSWKFWSRGDLDVEFVVKVPHEFILQLETAGGAIAIERIKGRITGETSGGDLSLKDTDGDTKLETSGGNVHVHKSYGSLNLETSGGDIVMSEVTGDVKVETSGGNIRMTDVEGKISAETSGGNVVVRVRSSNKGIFAETSGGDIDVALPKSVSATIDAETNGGSVSCDLPVTTSGRITESRLCGTVNGGGPTIHAHTSGGDVRISCRE
jgi:DUF4097 and DUF4098 domain-containing protein YvlB